jgi:hypothetical protein
MHIESGLMGRCGVVDGDDDGGLKMKVDGRREERFGRRVFIVLGV